MQQPPFSIQVVDGFRDRGALLPVRYFLPVYISGPLFFTLDDQLLWADECQFSLTAP